MDQKNLPNVLPDGALKAISHSDLVLAKLKNDSKPRKEILDNQVEK